MKGISNRGACKCRQHQFSLKPINKDLHYSRKVEVSMCECDKTKQKKKISRIRQQRTSAYPIFNRDGNYATPAFIIHSQKEHFEQNRHIYLKDHARKIRQYDEISENLYLPAPRSNHDYCNVCCLSYSNYIEHITSDDHHKKIKKSKFNNHILEIQHLFQNTNPENSMKRSIHSRMVDVEEQSVSGMFGYKKVKTIEERTEVPEQRERNGIGHRQQQQQMVMSQRLLKQYHAYCQLNHMMMYEHHKQQNMIEKRHHPTCLPPYNPFYTPPQLIRSQFQLMQFYRQCCYWQSLCHLTQQQQFTYNNQYPLHPSLLDNAIYCGNLSMPQTNTISIPTNHQLLYYYPSYLPHIETVQ